jgi:hypothetical protein
MSWLSTHTGLIDYGLGRHPHRHSLLQARATLSVQRSGPTVRHATNHATRQPAPTTIYHPECLTSYYSSMISDDVAPEDVPRIWRYSEGKWDRIPDPLYAEIGSPNVYDDWLAEAGFEHVDAWCGSYPTVHVYERTHPDDSQDQWRIEYQLTGVSTHKVMVPTLPDHIELLAKLATIALASQQGYQVPGTKTK